MVSALVKAPLRSVVLLWLGWAILLLGFQALAVARFDLKRPDNALAWSAAETRAPASVGSSWADAFIAPHLAWDSEYYLSVALHGYHDPALPVVTPDSTPDDPDLDNQRDRPAWPSVSAAFLPGYPAAIRVVAWPLQPLGLSPTTTAALAGIAVSLLGALGAMLAIFDLGRAGADEAQGFRAAFYLAIWPASIFLAQVYSEGLFLGLSFGALAMMRRGRWGWAALLAAAAVWTRATGALLLIPFVWTWLAGRTRLWPISRPTLSGVAEALCVAAPALAYLAWRFTLGGAFDFVETHYFGRGLLWLGPSWDAWADMLSSFADAGPQTQAYDLFEFAAVIIALIASVALWRRDRPLATYGLAVLVIALTSGGALGMQRYALSLPALFLAPAAVGARPLFDRLWTLANCLGLALLAITFSFGFWTG